MSEVASPEGVEAPESVWRPVGGAPWLCPSNPLKVLQVSEASEVSGKPSALEALSNLWRPGGPLFFSRVVLGGLGGPGPLCERISGPGGLKARRGGVSGSKFLTPEKRNRQRPPTSSLQFRVMTLFRDQYWC